MSEHAQWDLLRLAAKGKHRPILRLIVDLTSALPFVRVHNDVHGIHLVVFFA
ncbi:hypothetical protein BOO71_0005092 [Deinococcus marmoris]|uniref:Uncharacterized protein n=1 Tax=Deinococcus marmoris TaxID=249408 RepID=A0A1U7P0J2_9DEIO|nr:hypothetical protein BOO71_0009379 [Deinococcus marmoris]OLV18684.1 hypothetical protein BOO71_0005092 [Deinococcus marmoris]